MIGKSRHARNRDIALTTLIDLLVQIIFVFALILVSVDAVGNESRESGWVTPEAWKTLISIFDIDPRTIRETGAQAAEMKDRYEKAKEELSACDAKSGACDKPAGRGPGYPPCRNSAGVEMIVADATIDRDGRIMVARGRHASELQAEHRLGAGAFGVPLSVERFGALFRPWREHGLARSPACSFKAELSYDSRAAAGDYEPARRAVASFFTLSAPAKRF